eukprot:79489_1
MSHEPPGIPEENKSTEVDVSEPIIIQKGDIISHYIQPTEITHDTVTIQLTLPRPIPHSTAFYMHQPDKEDNDHCGRIEIKKNTKSNVEDVDLDEVDFDPNKSFKIALYQQENDPKPISGSNAIQITLPDADDLSDDEYKPNAIDVSTVKAIQTDDDQIYVYFDVPHPLRGEEIAFTIQYVSDSKHKPDYIPIPLALSPSSIPISFQIITSSTIDDEEYLSHPSKVITIQHESVALMINYVHSDDDNIKIEFNPEITFNAFKQIISNTLELNEDNDFQIAHIGGDKKPRLINERGFHTFLPLVTLSLSSGVFTTLCVGFKPDVPIIEQMNTSDPSQVDVTLQRAFNNINATYWFEIEPKNEEDKDTTKALHPNTKELHIEIKGLNPTGIYRLRVKAVNEIAHSDFTAWSPWQNTQEHDEKEREALGTYHGEQPLSHFLQITSINNEDFDARLDVLDVHTRKRTFVIKNMLNVEADLDSIVISKRKRDGESTIDFEDGTDAYKLAVCSQNALDSLSNTIELSPYAFAQYPPSSDSNYRPNGVDPDTIIQILDQNNEKVHLYWNVPKATYGDITYGITYDHDPQTEQKQRDDMVTVLPFSIPLKYIPTTICVVTISTFGDKQYSSQPVTIQIGSKQDTTTETDTRTEATRWSTKPSYFIQIVAVNEEDFTLHLLSDCITSRKRRFQIKEIDPKDGTAIGDVDWIPILKQKQSGTCEIDIDETHEAMHHLAVFDREGTQVSNVIQFERMKNEMNSHYKPNPIDLSTLLRVKDEDEKQIELYWDIPPKSFGKMRYKIIKNDNEDEKDARAHEIIDLLPYCVPLAIPMTLKVVTIAVVDAQSYESSPSQAIALNTDALPVPRLKPTIQSWAERSFSNLLQILSVHDTAITIKLQFEDTLSVQRHYTVQDMDRRSVIKQWAVAPNQIAVMVLDATPNTRYHLAICLDGTQISNAVRLHTAPTRFKPEANYKPLPPLKHSIHMVYDERKENILISWDCPQQSFGDQIKYKIHRSDKKECHTMDEMPYKLAINTVQTPSIALNVSTLCVIHGTTYCSKPSQRINIEIPNDLISKSMHEPLNSPASFLTIEYLNQSQSSQYIPAQQVQAMTFDQFKGSIIEKCNVNVNASTMKGLVIRAMMNSNSEEINPSNFKQFVCNELSKPGIVLHVFHSPRLFAPPILKKCTIDGNTLFCEYSTDAPFRLQYEIKSSLDSHKSTTKDPTNSFHIPNLSSRIGRASFKIRTKCVLSNVITLESDWSEWSEIKQQSHDHANDTTHTDNKCNDEQQHRLKTVKIRFVNQPNENVSTVRVDPNTVTCSDFVALCKGQFDALHHTALDDVVLMGDTNDEAHRDAQRYTPITATAFSDYLNDKHKSHHFINIGTRPQKPNVQVIKRNANHVEIATDQIRNDDGHYRYHFRLFTRTMHNKREHYAAKNHHNTLDIDGLQPNETYFIDICIFNGVVRSEWSGRCCIPPHTVGNRLMRGGDDNKVGVPDDEVLKYDGQARYIWYFTQDVLTSSCVYFCEMHDDTRQFVFQELYTSKKTKCGVYCAIIPQQKTCEVYPTQFFLCLKVYKKKGQKTPNELVHTQANVLYRSNRSGCYGFCFPASHSVHILDATCNTWYGGVAANKISGSRKFYDEITSQFIAKLMKSNNTTIPPYICMLSMNALWRFIVRDCKKKEDSTHTKRIETDLANLCGVNSPKNQIDLNNIHTWQDASRLLATAGALMLIGNSSSDTAKRISYGMTAIVLERLYQWITDLKIFGDLNSILSNIERIYYDEISALQTSFWFAHLKSKGIAQLRYLLWYNLLCCVRQDPSKFRNEREIECHATRAEFNKMCILDNRLNAAARIRPHIFNDIKTAVVMRDPTTTYQHIIELVNTMEETNQIVQFLTEHKGSIVRVLNDDISAWLDFAGNLFDILSIKPSIELQKRTIDLFQPQMNKIRENHMTLFLQFYNKYYKIIQGSDIEDRLIFYSEIVKCTRFIPKFVHALLPKSTQKTQYNHAEQWCSNLLRCTQLWLDDTKSLPQTMHILRDNQLNQSVLTHVFESNNYKIHNYIQNDFTSKLDMISSNEYEQTIKRSILNTIHHSLNGLNHEQHAHLVKTVDALMRTQYEMAESILRKLINPSFSPFGEHHSDKQIILYVISPKGIRFLNLLISLNKSDHFHELSISRCFTSFDNWWQSKIKQIALQTESYSTIDSLAKNDNFNTIHDLFSKLSFRSDDKTTRTAVKHLDQYTKIKERALVIDSFINHFTPSSRFYGDDIKTMQRLNNQLNKWDVMTLQDVFALDFAIYDKNEDFLRRLHEYTDTSRIKVSVFKSFIASQENEWTLKPLQQFSRRETAQWMVEISSKLEEQHLLRSISMEYILQRLYDNQISGKLLADDALSEDKIVGWFIDDEDDDFVDEYERIAAVLIECINARKIKDAQLQKQDDTDKQYDFDLLKKAHDQLDDVIRDIADKLSVGITVGMTQRYLSGLAQEDEKQIEGELRSIVEESDANIDLNETVKSIKSIFSTIETIDQYKALHDASQIFKRIMTSYNDEHKDVDWDVIEDAAYKERQEQILSKDISKQTINQLTDTIKQQKAKILSPVAKDNDERKDIDRDRVNHDHILQDVGSDYLRIFNSSQSIIIELFEKYHDNRTFSNRLRLFSTDSQINKQRSIALKKTRDFIVHFVKNRMKKGEILMTRLQMQLRERVIAMTEEDVKAIKIVTKSWKAMLNEFGDPAADQYTNNLKILNSVRFFEFGDESKQNVFDRDDTTRYLMVVIDCNDIEENKEHETRSQNRFSSLLDGISIFITGSDGIPADIPHKPFELYSEHDVVKLIKAKQPILGLLKPHKIYSKIKRDKITGAKITEKDVDIKRMTQLLFPNELQTSMEPETVKKIANEIVKTIDFIVLQDRIENQYIPRFEKCKELAVIRLNYYFEGGRDALNDGQQRRISMNASLDQLSERVLRWEARLIEWKEHINQLRNDLPALCYYTVNDMRYLIKQINDFKQGNDPLVLIKLAAKLSYIDYSISSNDVETKLEANCEEAPSDIKGLGILLHRMFGDRLYLHDHIQMKIGKPITLLTKKQHLFFCENQAFVLHRVIKLFLSRSQRPTANRTLFCDQTTTMEQVQCLLMRCQWEKYSEPPLFCIVQPELLQTSVQIYILNALPKYIKHSHAIITIITTTKDNKIYQKWSAFKCWNLPVFCESEKKEFFESILCKSDAEFNSDEEEYAKPLCKLIMSQNECVGKTYRIQKMAEAAGYTLIHVPINTKIADLDFIVHRMYSQSVAPPNKIAFHFNVSGSASYDVNVILFQLLVLRYITKHSGECFAVLPNHAFFVELPSRLSSLKATTMKHTLKHFQFVTKSEGIIHLEIQDSLKTYTRCLWTERDKIMNELDVSNKEMFVFKYLDAMDRDMIINKADASDWDHNSHHSIDQDRRLHLIDKYCQPARTSLVFLKSYLQYMYQQLILLYTSAYAQNMWSEIYEYRNKHKTPQYHRLIANSLTKSGEQIACHMYPIPELTAKAIVVDDDTDDEDGKDDEKEISEATGHEEFFLVKYWAEPITKDGKAKKK